MHGWEIDLLRRVDEAACAYWAEIGKKQADPKTRNLIPMSDSAALKAMFKGLGTSKRKK